MKRLVAAGLAAWLCGSVAIAASGPDSKRMARAKDFIADEQWTRATAELQAAADDPKEPNRDEALFWLAHSEHQAGDDSGAIQTIARLERAFPASRWVRLARSVRVEIAQRMRREDVLWAIAVPPAPPPPPVGPTPAPAATTPAVASAPPGAVRPLGRMPRPPRPPTSPPTPAAAVPTPPPAPPAPVTEYWIGQFPFAYDTDLKIEALGGLIDTYGDRVIPLLREIALDRNSPDEARRAVFVLARSQRPEAHNTVIEVARSGAEPVQLAAIRELGRFQGAAISGELMRVYSAAGTPRIKRQVVSSLCERFDDAALFRIASGEADPVVRNSAIIGLGRIPNARTQLRQLYPRAPRDSRPAVLTALFAARDEDELIRIAESERDTMLRQVARQQLRLLATPKALKFLQEHP